MQNLFTCKNKNIKFKKYFQKHFQQIGVQQTANAQNIVVKYYRMSQL